MRILIAALLSLAAVSGCMRETRNAETRDAAPGAARLLDPVCGMTLDPNPRYKTEYNGRTYAFCSETCLNRFKASPETYPPRI